MATTCCKESWAHDGLGFEGDNGMDEREVEDNKDQVCKFCDDTGLLQDPVLFRLIPCKQCKAYKE